MQPTAILKLRKVLFFFGIFLIFSEAVHAVEPQTDWTLAKEGEGYLAYERERDSLTQILDTAENDQARVDLLNKFANDFFDQSIELSLDCAQKALKQARDLDYTKGEIDAQVNIGEVHVNQTQDYAQGLTHLTAALGLIKGKEYPMIRMNIYRLLGFLNYRQSGLEKGIENYNKAIVVAQENDWKGEVSDLQAYIGDLYEVAEKMDLAMESYRKIWVQEEPTGYVNTRPAAVMAVGRYFYLLEDYDRAGEIYAIALQNFKDKGYHRWTAYTLGLVGELQVSLGNPQKGLKFAAEGLNLAIKYKLTKEIGDCHHAFVVLYDALGNDQKAYYHFKEETEINNKIFNLDRATQIAKVQANYENKMREKKLEQVTMEKEMQQKRTRIISIAGVCGIVLISLLAIFWYSAYRQKMKVNAQLADRVELKDLALGDIVVQLRKEIELHKQTQTRLETTHIELNHFIYKSSHDLKGPLASIIGLTDVASDNIPEAERLQYVEMIRQSSSRLSKKLDELIHATRLTEGPLNIKKINIAAQIREIADGLKEQDYAIGVRLEIVAAPDLEIKTDRHLLSSLLLSIIENSLQYKDLNKPNPFAKIKAVRAEKGVEVTVSDNGQGILKSQVERVFDMFVKSNTDYKKSGLGLYLAKKTAIKLGGNITLESEENVGTTVTIFFTDHGINS